MGSPLTFVDLSGETATSEGSECLCCAIKYGFGKNPSDMDERPQWVQYEEGGTGKFGFRINVEMVVVGNPGKCHCYQNEAGTTIQFTWLNNKKWNQTILGKRDNEFPCPSNSDPLGHDWPMKEAPTDRLTITLQMIVEFKCVGTDGVTITNGFLITSVGTIQGSRHQITGNPPWLVPFRQ
jgi:hypothetical protein